MTARPEYVCSKCGGGQVRVNEARPSVDDRYPLGWCERCTPVPKRDPDKPGMTKPLVRSTVMLVRRDAREGQARQMAAAKEQSRRESLVRRRQAGRIRDEEPGAAEADRILGDWLGRA